MTTRDVKEKVEKTIIVLAERCADPDIKPDDVEALANGADYFARVLERLEPTAGKS